MDIEEIEIMARCAGLMKYVTPPGTREWHGDIEDIAALVRGAIRNEREACAAVAEEFEDDMGYGKAQQIAGKIRMRSNA
jgi:hypothetical protein